ncbi:MAG: class I SAM-dependent methyltransferase [Candidatus Riflebacteria bacterium]|nr:class I SAM-dependent methyltransferase [Candidatus Riflebacteria bacterium]
MQTRRASSWVGTGTMTRDWRGLVACLLLWSWLPAAAPVHAQSAVTTGPGGAVASESEDYPSGLLAGPIRICPGTDWPARSETLVMPLMTANREKFKGKTVLDIGTGSGILALYAAQLGASKVVATDIEPRALACAQENARRLGLEKVIETRLVSVSDPAAYSVIRPEETFDIIISFPYCGVNRQPTVVSGVFDDGVTPDDTLRFGFSIIKGLPQHLGPEGVALVGYRFSVAHTLIVGYARHLGLVVEHHPALLIPPLDWYAMYNTFAAHVARTEQIDPKALLLERPKNLPDDQGGPGSGVYIKVDYASEKGVTFPQLWDGELDRVLPGMIVIRKKARQPTGAGPAAPARQGEAPGR